MTRFADLIQRQLAFFREDHADLIEVCNAAERAYDRAERDEAEARYSEYLDLVEEAVDEISNIRDTYGATLDQEARDAYEEAFDREVKRHLPRFGLGL